MTRGAVKLGRTPSGPTPHLPVLSSYTTGIAPPHPVVDWAAGVPAWPVSCNDTLGCCTISALAHLVQAYSTAAGSPDIASDFDIKLAYSEIAGYRYTAETDNGCRMVDVLTKWGKDGVVINGETDVPTAFCRVFPHNLGRVKSALAWFGPLYVGALLPPSAQATGPWPGPADPRTDADTPGGWGGHCMILTSMADDHCEFVTWGTLQRAAIAWWNTYIDECWAIVHPRFLSAGRAASGIDFDALIADMADMRKDSSE